MNHCFIVVGCYRTGSSGVAGKLHELGVNMGRRFLPANANNPKGYFEDQDFVEAHRNFDPDRYRQLIERKASGLWGFKDPFFSVVAQEAVPIVLSVCPVSLIVCHRDEAAIVDSLSRAVPGPDFTPLVRHHLGLIEAFLKNDLPTLHVLFEELTKPETEERLRTFVTGTVQTASTGVQPPKCSRAN